MTDHDFFAAMAVGIPPITPPQAPAANRCECDTANHHGCEACEAVDHALRQYAPAKEQNHG